MDCASAKELFIKGGLVVEARRDFYPGQENESIVPCKSDIAANVARVVARDHDLLISTETILTLFEFYTK